MTGLSKRSRFVENNEQRSKSEKVCVINSHGSEESEVVIVGKFERVKDRGSLIGTGSFIVRRVISESVGRETRFPLSRGSRATERC